MIPDPLLAKMRHVHGLLQAGNLSAARQQLEVIVNDNPGYAEARRLLAGAQLALGDAPTAERMLRDAAALDPTWSPTLTMLGELLLNRGQDAEAEQFLRRAATGAKADPRAALVLAGRYNASHRHTQALAVVAPFCSLGHAVPELAEQHVTALVALGRVEDAIAFYQQLLARSPDDPVAAHALAAALQASNRHREAERVAAASIERGQRTAALCHARARSLIAMGAFERAEAALHECLKLAPQRVDAHNDLARLVWMRAGDTAQATATLDDALRKFPGNDALWAARAAILQGAGDPRAAYACLATRVERPQPPPALLVRAGLAALEFDPRTALDLARRALRAMPGNGSAQTLEVAARLGIGDARGALPGCEALRAQSPDDQYLIALQTTAWRMLGDARYDEFCDYRHLVVPYRLETPSGWPTMGAFLADLERGLGAMHDGYRHPLLFQSLRHGTETTADLTRSPDPALRTLFAAFDDPIRDYMTRIAKCSSPLQRRNLGAYRFNGSWSVRLRTQGFHHNHVHPRGWISSSCYIRLPATTRDANGREGVLTFAEPGIVTAPPLPAEYEVRPEAGMLVLFPSYFWHGTVPFSGNDTRLTVAFDALPARPGQRPLATVETST